MTTYRRQYSVISGGIATVRATPKEAWEWINSTLTEAQQLVVVIKPILVEVPDLKVSRPGKQAPLAKGWLS